MLNPHIHCFPLLPSPNTFLILSAITVNAPGYHPPQTHGNTTFQVCKHMAAPS